MRDVIIKHIRARVLSPVIEKWSDEELVRRVFFNFCHEDAARLTKFGHTLLRNCFKSYEFEVAAALQPAHLVFLSKRCKMPYYYGDKTLALYDAQFAVMFRLAGHDLNTMIEVDCG